MVRVLNISANRGDLLQNLSYTYDAVGNITEIEQSAGSVNGLGGEYHNYYIYDDLNRLNNVYCKQLGLFDYDFSITMSPTGRIGEKKLIYAAGAISSHQLNGYDAKFTTHQPRVIYDQARGSQSLFWDANGNLSQTVDCKTGFASIQFWDEENRLRLAVNPKYAGYYGYDANGERVYKLTGRTQYDDLNGSNPSFGIIFDGLTVYPSPYIVLTKKQYTKHYYAGTDKIATMIGDGGLLLEQSHLTNEQRSLIKDGFCRTFEPTTFQYEKTMNIDIQGMSQSKIEYECGYIDRVDLSINSFTPMLEPMMQIWQNSNGCKNEIYYTHGDHLGSANWITDVKGNPIQYIHYAPYGEQIANQQTIGYDERFKFTGKERDWETGYDYFGARFYDHRKGIWNSVDPLADKYPGNTPYIYCLGNPIVNYDPDGRSTYTDVDGNVIEVRDDNDSGVYRWNPQTEQYDLMGVSWHPLSFCDQSKYNDEGIIIPQKIKIDFGSTELGDAINAILSENPSLVQYALKAKSGEIWDLKAHYQNGSLVNGKYASPRDAGNMLAGAVKYRSGILAPIVQYGYGAYNLSGNSFGKTAVLIIENMGFLTLSVPVGISVAVLIYNGEDKLTQRSIDNGYKYIR